MSLTAWQSATPSTTAAPAESATPTPHPYGPSTIFIHCVQGGASRVNFHGGGNGAGYTPIADSNGTVAAAHSDYYGILFFTPAGHATLYPTQLSANGLYPTAHTLNHNGPQIKCYVPALTAVMILVI